MVAEQAAIDRVIRQFREAAEAARDTPSRAGNLVALGADDGDDVMVCADLHGQRLNFKRLLAIAALDDHPRRHLIMQEVCHGGPNYPGGGCMSHLLLEDAAELKVRYPQRFHFLLSNHELAELTDFPIAKASRMLNLQFRCGLRELYGERAEEVRAAAIGFIASCPLAVRLENRVFICHSTPENLAEKPFDASVFERELEDDDFTVGGAVFRLVWGRDFRAENADEFCRLVDADLLIQGHEPCARGYQTPNARQVILDSCGFQACYLITSIAEPTDQQQLVEQVRHLY